jgi:hypothetical protein
VRLEGFLKTLDRGIIVTVIEAVESLASITIVRADFQRIGGLKGFQRKSTSCDYQMMGQQTQDNCGENLLDWRMRVTLHWATDDEVSLPE